MHDGYGIGDGFHMDYIYLDHNATTPVDPEVIAAMLPYLGDIFGNASSVHAVGRQAKVALETAREQIAEVINCKPAEFYFTSGGTESDNMAVLGTMYHFRNRRNHLIVGSTEHHAVLEAAQQLANDAEFKVDFLTVNRDGFTGPVQLADLITDGTALVSVMHANNETGTIQDISALASVAHDRGALFHTDAVQSVGKIPVDVQCLGVDMLSLTAHKIYGPKGVGGLFVKQGVRIAPLFYGGSQERKRRPGTENVAGAVGLAKALELAQRRMVADQQRLTELANYFIVEITAGIPDVTLNGPRENRIPQTVNLCFAGVEGESIVLSLDLEGISCSSGSACSSGATGPSHVLAAMGVEDVLAQSAIRFSMGHSTTKDQLDYVIEKLTHTIRRLRDMSPMYTRRKP
jgi:cysteine desulfurase